MTHDVSKVREVRRALAQGVGITDPCGQATGGGEGRRVTDGLERASKARRASAPVLGCPPLP
jgi:hypothetical protein